jgi:AraC-like DNA-binding protein
MTSLSANPPKGVLNPRESEKHFRLMRFQPSGPLALYIEHYWSVHWDLRGREPYISEVLPYPSVHAVFENGTANVYGVMTGRFTKRLEGMDSVFAFKFKPGAFYPFAKRPVSELTDRVTKLTRYFGKAGRALQDAVLATQDDEERLELTEAFLLNHIPKADESLILAGEIVARITGDREITKVDDVVNRCHLNKRTLQRLFNQYVGVSPKWVIRRCRLHEAAHLLAEGGEVDWARLAVDLGYFDQAHFIKDFKKMVGVAPAAYAKGIA